MKLVSFIDLKVIGHSCTVLQVNILEGNYFNYDKDVLSNETIKWLSLYYGPWVAVPLFHKLYIGYNIFIIYQNMFVKKKLKVLVSWQL